MVVNPQTKKAVAEAQLTGKVQTQSAAQMDANGDGIVTQKDASILKAKSVAAGGGGAGGGGAGGGQPQAGGGAGGGAAAQTVSVLELIAPDGMWMLDVSHGQQQDSYAFMVSFLDSVPGPSGQMVKALGRLSVGYYVRDPYNNNGFFGVNGYQAQALAPWTGSAASGQRPWVSEHFEFVDAYGLYQGGRQDPYGWRWQRVVPATITIGRGYTLTWDQYGVPYDVYTGVKHFTEDLYVTLATDANGNPVSFADDQGLPHLVYHLQFSNAQATYYPNCQGQQGCPAQIAVPVPTDPPGYIIGGLGVWLPDLGSWPASLAAMQFGRIQTDPYTGAFKDATLMNPYATDPYGWGVPDKTTLLSWLRLAWDNRKNPQQITGGGGQGVPLDAWVPTDAYGNPKVNPLPYDPQWFTPQPITENTQQNFAATVEYTAPSQAQARLELRVWDSYAMQEVPLASGQPQTLPAAQTANRMTVSAALLVPTLQVLNTYGAAYAGQTVQEGWVDLFLV
ncbi:MAG: hypothetical protein D6771_07625, partial [Zetaproteobacteria bacterium]